MNHPLISNAITHRDYSSNGSVKVSLNHEFLEIFSPGDFPLGTSWDDFLKNTNPVSQPINVIVSHYLAHLLVFEGIGRGFAIIRKYVEEYGKDSIICTTLPGPIVSIRVRRQISSSASNITSGLPQDLKYLIDKNTRRLQRLKLQSAKSGRNTPPEVFIEIEDLETEIVRLQTELSGREGEGIITQKPGGDSQFLNEMITASKRRLEKLKEQKARLGIHTPPEILLEIEEMEEQIAKLQVDLQNGFEGSY